MIRIGRLGKLADGLRCGSCSSPTWRESAAESRARTATVMAAPGSSRSSARAFLVTAILTIGELLSASVQSAVPMRAPNSKSRHCAALVCDGAGLPHRQCGGRAHQRAMMRDFRTRTSLMPPHDRTIFRRNRARSRCHPDTIACRCTMRTSSRSACSERIARRGGRSPWFRSAGRAAGRTISSSPGWPTRPVSISCSRSGAGRATAATPTTRGRRSRPSPGRRACSRSTKRVTVFGTVHAPLFNPVIAAKEMVTADHIGEGRFGLNIVVGWNEGEFEMFGVKQRDHEAALRIRAGMDRRHQDDLVGQGGLRLPGTISRT